MMNSGHRHCSYFMSLYSRDSEEAEDVGVSSSGSRQCTVTLQRAFKAILSNLVSSASELVAQMTEG